MLLTGELLLALAAKSTLALALAALLAKALGRASSAIKHLVWAAALACLLLLPFLGGVLPGWHAPVPAGLAIVVTGEPTVVDVVASRPGFHLSPVALAWGIWAIGFGIVLLHTATGLVKVARVIRGSRPLDGWGPNVFGSPDVPVPVVCGFWRPRVILPDDARTWTAARLRMVLKHERMHISRHDTRTHVLTQFVCALYWANPLVWYAGACLRREAEQACDDGVLEQGESPALYAGELVEIVQGLRTAGDQLEGGLAMGRVSELEGRLKAMLKSGSSRRKATPLVVTGACILSLIVLLPLAALRAPAQQAGAIAGVVSDGTGAVVPGARVTVLLTGTDRKEFTSTNATGRFTLRPVPDGTYGVTVAASGFALYKLEGIQVKGGAPADLQVVLNIGTMREAMEVNGGNSAPTRGVVGGVPGGVVGGVSGGVQPPIPPLPGVASAPAAPAPPDMPQRIRVGGNLQYAKMTKKVNPSYPPDCKAEGIEGTVALRATIGRDGGVLNLERINELVDGRLAQAAMDSVRQWRYQPTLLNGQPVEIVTEIEVNFTLSK
jgi:TonB family protein